MKHMINTALVAATAVLLSASMAFATTQKVHTTIPFPFFVNGTAMPAGSYTIFPVTGTEIEVEGAHTTALVSVIQTTPGDSASLKGALSFDRLGDRYFLRGVECDYAGIHVEIPTTKREKSARAGQAESCRSVEHVSVAVR